MLSVSIETPLVQFMPSTDIGMYKKERPLIARPQALRGVNQGLAGYQDATRYSL